MWEAIVVLAKTPAVVALVVGIFGLLFYMVKKGMLSFKGKGVELGQDTKTRSLIQNQLEYASAKCEGLIILYKDKVDVYKLKYIISRIENIFERAIVLNNMTDNEDYIKAKQELVYQAILKRSTCAWVLEPDFKAFIYKFVADVFTDLYRMKRINM